MFRILRIVGKLFVGNKSNSQSAVRDDRKAVSKQIAREMNAINDFFAELGIDGSIDPAKSVASPTGNFVQYKVALVNKGQWAKVKSLGDQLTGLITELRGDREEVPVSISATRLFIEAPYPGKVKLLTWADALPALLKLKYGQCLLGRSFNGRYVDDAIVDFTDSRSPHFMLGATTGAGKTVEINNIVVSACYAHTPQQLIAVIIDPKGSLRFLDGLPHTVVVRDMNEAGKVFTALVLELDRRNREDINTPLIMVVIDELRDLLMTHGEEVEFAIGRIAQLGRERGIHLVAATQHPTVEAIGSALKANLPVRIAGRVASANASKLVLEQSGCGAEKLAGRGSFYVKIAEVQRVQSYFIDGKSGESAIAAIGEKWQGIQRAPIDFLAIAASEAVAKGQASSDVLKILADYSVAALFDLEMELKKPGDLPLRRSIQAEIVRHLCGPEANVAGGNRTRALRALRIIYNDYLNSVKDLDYGSESTTHHHSEGDERGG